MSQPWIAATPPEVYRRLLDEEVRVELIDGEVVVHASPGLLHGLGMSALGSDLHQAFQRGRGGPGGWWILFEVDVELEPGAQAYRPDIVGWRRERLIAIPKARPVPIVPDFVCEVLSPSNARWDLVQKMNGYARAGVPWYWILEPEAQRLNAYELAEGTYRDKGVVTRASPGSLPPFEALRLDLAEVFPLGAE